LPKKTFLVLPHPTNSAGGLTAPSKELHHCARDENHP